MSNSGGPCSEGPADGPISRLITAFIRLQRTEKRKTGQLEQAHEDRLRAVDRRYWADKAQLEQRYQEERATENTRYRQALREARNQFEADSGAVYRTALEEEEHILGQAERGELLPEAAAVEVEDTEEQEVEDVIQVHSKVSVLTPVKLAQHARGISNLQGTVVRYTKSGEQVWVRIWNKITNKIEEHRRQLNNVKLIRES